MINKKFLTFLLLSVSVFSCNSIKQQQKTTNNEIDITLNVTECGSYEVKNNNKTIGYVVKPFIINKVNRINEITDFEQKLKIKYKNKFKKKYRIYAFTLDRAGDTILLTHFLYPKKLQNNPDWKCMLQAVNVYPKKTFVVFYNCSKNRFKIPGDPD